jgi:hypothetical protein
VIHFRRKVVRYSFWERHSSRTTASNSLRSSSPKTYHEEALTLRDDDYEDEPIGDRSHVLPWSLATLNSAADVDHYLTALVDDHTEDVASQLIDYISS